MSYSDVWRRKRDISRAPKESVTHRIGKYTGVELVIIWTDNLCRTYFFPLYIWASRPLQPSFLCRSLETCDRKELRTKRCCCYTIALHRNDSHVQTTNRVIAFLMWARSNLTSFNLLHCVTRRSPHCASCRAYDAARLYFFGLHSNESSSPLPITIMRNGWSFGTRCPLLIIIWHYVLYRGSELISRTGARLVWSLSRQLCPGRFSPAACFTASHSC